MNEKLLIHTAADVAATRAMVLSLKDVLLQTQEQKDQYDELLYSHVKTQLTPLADELSIENPEEFVQAVLEKAQAMGRR